MSATRRAGVRTWRALGAGCIISAASTLTGCATTVVPPAASAVPAEVFIVDHGRTSSLVIPASDGGMLRYAYGDWNYYALRKTGLWHGIAAVLWPTRSGLGRAKLHGPASPENLQRQVSSAHSVHAVRVERARVLDFERRMEDLYDSRRATEVENRPYGMTFVQHPRPYTYFWNSNHAVAAWLRELGCETHGPSFRANWRISEPSQPGTRGATARCCRPARATPVGGARRGAAVAVKIDVDPS